MLVIGVLSPSYEVFFVYLAELFFLYVLNTSVFEIINSASKLFKVFVCAENFATGEFI